MALILKTTELIILNDNTDNISLAINHTCERLKEKKMLSVNIKRQ